MMPFRFCRFASQVGIAATQLGKKLGLRVIGTAGSAEGLELVKKNGADAVFNHHDKDYVQQVKVSDLSLSLRIIST